MIGLPYMALGAAVAVAIAGTAGFAAGWRAKDVRCDLAEAQREQVVLTENIRIFKEHIKLQQKAIDEDSEAAARDAELILSLETKANELQGKISSGICFTPDDVERLRNLFGPSPDSKRKAPARQRPR